MRDDSGLDLGTSRRGSEDASTLRCISKVETKLFLDINLHYYFCMILNTLTTHLFTLPH